MDSNFHTQNIKSGPLSSAAGQPLQQQIIRPICVEGCGDPKVAKPPRYDQHCWIRTHQQPKFNQVIFNLFKFKNKKKQQDFLLNVCPTITMMLFSPECESRQFFFRISFFPLLLFFIFTVGWSNLKNLNFHTSASPNKCACPIARSAGIRREKWTSGKWSIRSRQKRTSSNSNRARATNPKFWRFRRQSGRWGWGCGWGGIGR